MVVVFLVVVGFLVEEAAEVVVVVFLVEEMIGLALVAEEVVATQAKDGEGLMELLIIE